MRDTQDSLLRSLVLSCAALLWCYCVSAQSSNNTCNLFLKMNTKATSWKKAMLCRMNHVDHMTWRVRPRRWGWISGCTSSSSWTGWLCSRGSRFWCCGWRTMQPTSEWPSIKCLIFSVWVRRHQNLQKTPASHLPSDASDRRAPSSPCRSAVCAGRGSADQTADAQHPASSRQELGPDAARHQRPTQGISPTSQPQTGQCAGQQGVPLGQHLMGWPWRRAEMFMNASVCGCAWNRVKLWTVCYFLWYLFFRRMWF